MVSGVSIATSQFQQGLAAHDILSGVHEFLPDPTPDVAELEPAIEPIRRLVANGGETGPAPQALARAFHESAQRLQAITQTSFPQVSLWADGIGKIWKKGISYPPQIERALVADLKNDDRTLINWLRQFIEFSPQPMGVVRCHSDGSVEMVLFNQRNRERWGLGEQDVDGVDALRFFYPEDHEMVRAFIRECLETGSSERQGVRMLRSSGGHLLVDMYVGRVDATNYAYFQVIDETQREEALTQVRVRDAVFRNAGKPFLMLSFDEEDGTPSGMVTSAGFDTMMGYEPGEMGVKPVIDFIPRHLRPAFSERVSRFLETGTLNWPAVELVGKDGLSVLADIEANGSTINGRRFAIVSFGDAKARIAAERDAAEAEKLKIISEVSTAIAHDANNLITVISGLVQLLRESPEETEESYQDIMNNIDMLTAMLNGFRQMTDTVSGEFNLHTLLKKSVIQLIVPKIMGVKINQDLVQDPWPVAGPNFAVWQIIFNIIKNALESMAASSRKELSLGTENVSLPNEDALRRLDPGGRYPDAKPGDYLMLSVTDTGSGMAAETLERLFQDYFSTKADSEVRRGRGLYASQQAIRKRGGLLAVRSTPGDGTTFEIYLPRATEENEAATSAATTTSMLDQRWMSRTGEVVLIADDEENIRQQYARILGHYHGYRVLLAGTTEETLKIVREHPELTAIVMDWRMPGDTGDMLADDLRDLRPRIPILVNTGHIPENNSRRGLQFTKKLKGMINVARAVRRLIDGEPIDPHKS